MNTDKVLALAREADLTRKDLAGKEHVAYEKYITPYLLKFAALIQQQMIEDGWRQCAVGQGTSQFCGMVEELRKDAERYRWQMENPAIAFHYYKVRGFTTEYSAEIDRARSCK